MLPQNRNVGEAGGNQSQQSTSSSSKLSGEQHSLSGEEEDIRESLLAGGYIGQEHQHRDQESQHKLAAAPTSPNPPNASISSSTRSRSPIKTSNESKSSSSSSPLKFPRPKSFLSNLKSTVAAVSNLTATSTSSFSTNTLRARSNSSQSLSGSVQPVSSLVLSPSRESLSSGTNENGQGSRYLSSLKSNSSISSGPYNFKSKANKSEPNLSTEKNLSLDSRSKFSSDSPKLLVRNLDQAPRGTLTPQVSNPFDYGSSSTPRLPKDRSGRLENYSERKMTNPWGLIEIPIEKDEKGNEEGQGQDEVEESLQQGQLSGKMASEERAVLDMLDSMRDSPSTSRLAISPNDEVVRYELHDSPQINQLPSSLAPLNLNDASSGENVTRYELHDSPQISQAPSSWISPQVQSARENSSSSTSTSSVQSQNRPAYLRTKSTSSASNVGIAPNSPASRSLVESAAGSDDGRRGSAVSIGSTGSRFRDSNLSSTETGEGRAAESSSRTLAPAFSPSKMSVRSFASAIDQQQASARPGSTSGGSSVHSSGGSGSKSRFQSPTEQSSVKNVIREKEESSKLQEVRRGSQFSSKSSPSSFVSASPATAASRFRQTSDVQDSIQGASVTFSPEANPSSPRSDENQYSPIHGSAVSSSNNRGTDMSRSTSGTAASTSLWSRVIRRPESPEASVVNPLRPGSSLENDSSGVARGATLERYGLPSSSDGNNLPEGFRFNRDDNLPPDSSSAPKPRLRRDWTIATSMAPSLGGPSKIGTIQEAQVVSPSGSNKASKSSEEEVGSELSGSNRMSVLSAEEAEIRSVRNVSVRPSSGAQTRELKAAKSSPVLSTVSLNSSVQSESIASSNPPPRAVLASVGASQDNANISASLNPESSVLRSPGKAKDLIKFFEQNSSATSSPSTPRTAVNNSTKSVTPSSGLAKRLRRAMGVSESDAGLLSTQLNSPELLSYRRNQNTSPATVGPGTGTEVMEKMTAQSRIRPRVTSRLGGVTVGDDDVFGASSIDPDQENENPPLPSISDSSPTRRRPTSKISSSSLFDSSFSFAPNSKTRPVGNTMSSTQDSNSSPGRSRGESAPPPSNSNPLPQGSTAPIFRSDPPPGQSSSASLSKPGNDSSKKKAFSSGVKSFVNVFTKGVDFSNPSPPKHQSQDSSNGKKKADETPANNSASKPGISRSDTKQSAGGESSMSANTIGTTASFRRHSETGDLPLDSRGALSMLEGPVGLPFRVGTLFYFNVHTDQPYWQRVQATLLPSALALSWIPPGGGRENVLLSLKACREVHSVPSPDHPSSLEDVGAVVARSQGLDKTCPFQLIFEDGVERMAAENARERVQWVSAVWDALGVTRAAGSGPVALEGSTRAISQDAPGSDSKKTTPNKLRRIPVPAMNSPTPSPSRRAVGLPMAAPEEDLDRIGSVWKSELSSEKSLQAAPPTIEATLAAGPPVPPKDMSTRKRSSYQGPQASNESPHYRSSISAHSPNMVNPETAVQQAKSIPASLGDPSLVNSGSSARRSDSCEATKPEDEKKGSSVSSSTLASSKDGESQSSHLRSTEAEASSTDPRGSASSDSHESSPEMDYQSAVSNGSEMDEFGPRSPRSDAIFGTSTDRELFPHDSASQRAVQTDFSNLGIRGDLTQRRNSEKSVAFPLPTTPIQERMVEQSVPTLAAFQPARTPAQFLRDSIMANAQNADGTNQEAGPLETVAEETQSQAQSMRAPSRTPRQASGMVSAAEVDELIDSASSPRKSNRSLTSNFGTPRSSSQISRRTEGSVNSQDVARLLDFLEQQQEARAARDKQLEDQIKEFQEVIANLQSKGVAKSSTSSSRSRRRSSAASSGAGESRSGSELAAVQEKLDKVIGLVSTMYQDRARQEETGRSRGTPGSNSQGSQTPASLKNLSRIEETLQILLDRLHDGGSVSSRTRSFIRNAGQHSYTPRSNDLDAHSLSDHQLEALGVRSNPSASSRDRRVSAPSILEDGASIYSTATSSSGVGEYTSAKSSNQSHDMPTSLSSSDLSSAQRIPPRSWISAQGIPSPPPNTEAGGSVVHVQRDSDSMSTPKGSAQPVFMHGDASQALGAPRTAFAPNLSAVSLDMEAEIRRRRAKSTPREKALYPENEAHGWYTPKVERDGDFSDKSLPSTPRANYRSADGFSSSDARLAMASPWNEPSSGLGLSVPANSDRGSAAAKEFEDGRNSVTSPHTPKTPATPSAELTAVLAALKENELARQAQSKQQADIARYLNELNAWLEKDVSDRSKEWRNLATGVTQLHDELTMIKTGRPVMGGAGLGAANTPHLMGNTPHLGNAGAGGAGLLGTGLAAGLGGAIGAGGLRNPFDSTQSTPQTVHEGRVQMPIPTVGGVPLGSANTATTADPRSDAIPPTPLQVGRAGAPPIVDANTWTTNVTRPADGTAGGIVTPGPAASGIRQSSKRGSKPRSWSTGPEKESLGMGDAADDSIPISPSSKRKSASSSGGLKSKLGKALGMGAGASLASAAVHEWNEHKKRQRSEGKPEDHSSERDATTGAYVKHAEVPEPVLKKLKEAADNNDESSIREGIKKAAAAGAGGAALTKIVEHIESKGVGSDEDSDEHASDLTLAPSEPRAHPSPSPRKARFADEIQEPERKSGHKDKGGVMETVGKVAGGGALAIAVEEILKHLLERKEEEKKREEEEKAKQAEREARLREIEQSSLTSKEKEKQELADSILSKLMAEKKRQDEELAKKEKELDPKSAIESLVATMNSMREAESKKKLETEATVKSLAAELLKATNEQNSKLVEAVNQAAKDMLNHNVQAQAKEMQSVLHGSVLEMLQDVGRIRESKRHLEYEIAELFAMKSRHFANLDVASHDAEKNFIAKYGSKYASPVSPEKEKKEEKKKEEKKEVSKPLAAKDPLTPFSVNFGPRQPIKKVKP